MSICLYCGDCCMRMSEIANPCPLLIITDDNYYFCGDYDNRPEQCRNHQFDSRFCPIGLSILKLKTIDDIRIRIDDGWEKIKRLNPHPL